MFVYFYSVFSEIIASGYNVYCTQKQRCFKLGLTAPILGWCSKIDEWKQEDDNNSTVFVAPALVVF